jgi:putative restriction endonuclease
MNFEDWLRHRGLSQSTAEKYAGAISGSLSEWAIAGGILQGPLVAMESTAKYEVVSSNLSKLPIFIERNERGHNMYSSALAKFGNYLAEGFENDVESDVEAVLSDPNASPTEKVDLVKARIGQGAFRQKLLTHWQGCAVTGYKELTLLVASHIKPWRSSSNAERLDPLNGLLLLPNLDRAFDRGLVTFDEDGTLNVSPLLSEPKTLGITQGMATKLQPKHRPYMEFHRAHVYRAK